MNYEDYGLTPGIIGLLVAMVLWSLIWKGFALYRAGRVKDPVWFVVLLLVNTAGILEILYLFAFSKRAGKRELLAR